MNEHSRIFYIILLSQELQNIKDQLKALEKDKQKTSPTDRPPKPLSSEGEVNKMTIITKQNFIVFLLVQKKSSFVTTSL